MPYSVFINYRRTDADSPAMLIYQALVANLGQDAVFMDVDSILPGAPWPDRIANALEAAQTVVSVIGSRWLQAKDEWERRRIDQEEDWVRRELETALASGKRVIPVYVCGASPLPKAALPVSLQDLSDRESISLRHDHWNADIQLLLREYPVQAQASPHVGMAIQAHDQKQREEYLRQVADDLANRLDSSVHVARFIDLGIKHDPTAVGTLWGYRNPETQEEYPDLVTAFITARRRLLLLGHPGSGKTTALLHLAQTLIHQAQTNEQAPVPFFVNLSKFNRPTASSRHEKEDRLDTRFIDWLAEEMAEVPGMTVDVARQWLAQGKVAALLDGLDEFNDDRRPELAHLINTSFLRRYPSMIVVICSRTNDYALLRSSADSLKLEDAVELQPLTQEQIDDYLVAAEAAGLRDAIRTDPSLHDLAKTPLTLSMLALAYGGLPAEQMPKALSLTDSRSHLFEAYVHRRLQYDARRKVNKPMDDCRENDLPVSQYRYRPEKIHRWLGALAVVLSQRMTTVFTVERFHNLIMPDGWIGNEQSLRRRSAKFAKGVFVAFLSLMAIIPIVPHTAEGLAWAGVILALSLVCAWFTNLRDHGPEPEWPLPLLLGFSSSVGVLTLSYLIADWLGNTSPIALPPLVAASIIAILFLVGALISQRGLDSDTKSIVLVGSLALVVAGGVAWWTIKHPLWGLVPEWAATVSVTLVWVLMMPIIVGDTNWRKWAPPALIVFGIACLLCGEAWLIGYPNWVIVSICAPMVATGLFTTDSKLLIILLFVTGTSAFAGAFFGIPGTVLGAGGSMMASVILSIMLDRLQSDDRDIKSTFSRYDTHAQRWFEERLWSPSVWAYWALSQFFPLRKQPFFSFCQEIHLLKASNQGGMEFIHRLLRDYFALRLLMPHVDSQDGDSKLEAIRALGFQGEAAIDPLIEIAEKGGAATRAAALEGMSHIPSPAVTKCLESYLEDQRPVVRSALVSSLMRLAGEDSTRLLNMMIPLGDGCEVQPFVLGRVGRVDEDYVRFFVRKWSEPGVERLLHWISEDQFWVFDASFHRRMAAIDILVALGERRVVPLLVAALQSRELTHSQVVDFAYALNAMKEKKALLPLLQFVGRCPEESFGFVLQVLNELADDDAAQPLLEWLSKRPQTGGILPAVRIIRNHGGNREIQQLADLWPRLRSRLGRKVLRQERQLDQWLLEITKTRTVPSSRERWL